MKYGRTVGFSLVLVFLGSTLALAEPLVYRVQVDGLKCSFCLTEIRQLGALGVEKEFVRIPGVENATADVETGEVLLTMTQGFVLDAAALSEALEAATVSVRRAIEIREYVLVGFAPVEE